MRDSFILYTAQKEFFNTLTDEQAGQFIKGIFDYVNGEKPQLEGILKIAFLAIQQQLDKDE